jgi:hypothetical protein
MCMYQSKHIAFQTDQLTAHMIILLQSNMQKTDEQRQTFRYEQTDIYAKTDGHLCKDRWTFMQRQMDIYAKPDRHSCMNRQTFMQRLQRWTIMYEQQVYKYITMPTASILVYYYAYSYILCRLAYIASV